MVELGKFRAVAKEDLSEFAYGSNDDRMRPDVENLGPSGPRRNEIHSSRKKVVLANCSLLARTGIAFSRKPKVLAKDRRFITASPNLANLITMPTSTGSIKKRPQRLKIREDENLRVVLDYELKKRLYHDLAKLGEKRNSVDGKHAIAEKHGLKVVRGKIPVPDVRIEYETHDGGTRLAWTSNLLPATTAVENLSEKVRAGFSIYARADDVFQTQESFGSAGIDGGDSIAMRMPQETSRTHRRSRVHRTRGALPLFGGDAFRLLHATPIQRLCWRSSRESVRWLSLRSC